MERQLFVALACVVLLTFAVTISMADLNEGLLGYWKLDESSGTTAHDSSGNGHDAIFIGDGLSWEPDGGKIKGALRFDGSDSKLEDDDGEDYVNGLTAFTIAVWVKADETGTDRGFIVARDPNGESVFALRHDAAGVRGGGVNLIKADIPTTGGDQELESSDNVQTVDWQHIALTWESGKGLALYLNGVLDKPIFTYDAVEGSTTDADRLIIGKGGKDKSTSWSGLLDDFRIYSRALEPREIGSLASGRLSVELAGKLATAWAGIKRCR